MPITRKQRAHGRQKPAPKTVEQVAKDVLAKIARAGTELHDAVYDFPGGYASVDILAALKPKARATLNVMAAIATVLAPNAPPPKPAVESGAPVTGGAPIPSEMPEEGDSDGELPAT